MHVEGLILADVQGAWFECLEEIWDIQTQGQAQNNKQVVGDSTSRSLCLQNQINTIILYQKKALRVL